MGKAADMRGASVTIRVGAACVASLVAGCVQPAYVAPGPIALQPYPPPVTYEAQPAYRPGFSGPIPLQEAPLVEPLPPPTPAPTITEVPPADLGGAIPVQDMPAPVVAAPASSAPSSASTDAPAEQSPSTQVVRKTGASGPGNNVPLEGFRPMHGQSRPAS